MQFRIVLATAFGFAGLIIGGATGFGGPEGAIAGVVVFALARFLYVKRGDRG